MVSIWQQTDFAGYPGLIDANFAVATRVADAFAPRQQATPNLTLRLDPGFIYDPRNAALVTVAAQGTAAFTPPVSQPRIDRVVIDAGTGAVSVVTGTEAASPVPPAIPLGKMPVAQVLLPPGANAITNAMLGDERAVWGVPVPGIPWAIAAGTSDAIAASYAPANASLYDGMLLSFRATAANATTAPTFAPDGLMAYAITKDGGQPLVAGDIGGTLAECVIRFNAANTRWELLNPQSSSALPSIPNNDVLANISGSTAAPVGVAVSALIDSAIGSTRGAILERGAAGWIIIPPGASGFALLSYGAGSDPTYGPSVPWAIAAGTSDVITAGYTPANASLYDGLLLCFRAVAQNMTATPTFAPDGLTAYAITKKGGAALVAGDIAGTLAECIVRYNAAHTRWELLNPQSAYTPPAIPNNDLLANISGAAAAPVGVTLSALIDNAIGATRGAILERGTGGWTLIAPGASGTALLSYGTGSDPSYGPSVPWAIATGTSDAITASYTPANTSLYDGLLLCFRASAPNATTTPTFAPDGLTAYTITKEGGQALAANDIPGALAECILRYNAAHTRWELLNPAQGSGGGSGGLTWNSISTSTVAAANNGYILTGPSQVLVTTPASPTGNPRVQVLAQGTGGGALVPNTGQTITFGTTSVAAGAGFFFTQGASVDIVYVGSNQWMVDFNIGTLIVSAAAGDPFFNNDSFLLPLNGPTVPTNDSSGNGIALTNSGVVMSSTQTKYGTFSGQFNGAAHIGNSGTNLLEFGTADFTIECWVFATANGQSSGGAFISGPTGTPYLGFNASNAILEFAISNTSSVVNAPGSMSLNAWHHVAASRQGGTAFLFIDGVLQGSASSSTSFNVAGIDIGSQNGTANSFFTGYLTQVRLTKGVARYTANFAVPATGFGLAQDTSADPVWNRTTLQLPFENNATDQSGNAVTLTNNGSTPFSSSIVKVGSYSAGLFNGSSQYFNSSSSTALEFGTGDYTLEAWVYPTANGATGYSTIIGGNANNTITLTQTASTATVSVAKSGTGAFLTSSNSMSLNAWNHVAAVRSGVVVTVYINGVSGGSASDSNTWSTASANIGAAPTYSGTYFTGYLDNLRLSAFARYTANFTPPTAVFSTAPPTGYDPWWQNVTFMPRAVSGNSGTDVSGNGLSLTLTNIATSTSTTKQDAASWVFNGSSSVITVASPGSATKFSGDFTIEAWINPTSFTNFNNMIDTRTGSTSTGFQFITVQTSGLLSVRNTSTILTTATALSSGAWTHVALVRYAGVLYAYINGVQDANTASNSTNFSDGNITVGTNVSQTSGNWFAGNIAGLRVTKAARYTATFVPPTIPFLTVGGV